MSKDIKQVFDNFTLTPSTDLWESIELQLPKQNQRKPIVFWWLSAITIIVAVGLAYFITNKHQSSFNKNIQPIIVHQQKVKPKSPYHQLNKIPFTRTAVYLKANNNHKKLYPLLLKPNTIGNYKTNTTTIDVLFKNELKANNQQQTINIPNSLTSNLKDSINNSVVVFNSTQSITKTPTDSNTNISNKTNNSTLDITTKRNKNIKKWDWQLCFSMGSNNWDYSSLLDKISGAEKRYEAFSSPSALYSSVGSSSPQRLYSFSHIKNGINASMGVNTLYYLSNKTSVHLGLLYGLAHNTLSYYKDSLLSNNTTAYRFGTGNTKHLYMHYLSVPIMFQYSLYQKQHISLGLRMGVQLNYSIYNNMPENNLTYYSYVNMSSSNKFMLSANSGLYFKNNHFQAILFSNNALQPISYNNNAKKYFNQFNIAIHLPIHKNK